MSKLSSILAKGFTSLQAVLADEFTIAGATYSGVFTEEIKQSEFGDFSARETVIRTCRVTKSQFTAAPDPGARPSLVLESDTYYIVGVRSDQIHYLFDLEKRT